MAYTLYTAAYFYSGDECICHPIQHLITWVKPMNGSKPDPCLRAVSNSFRGLVEGINIDLAIESDDRSYTGQFWCL